MQIYIRVSLVIRDKSVRVIDYSRRHRMVTLCNRGKSVVDRLELFMSKTFGLNGY